MGLWVIATVAVARCETLRARRIEGHTGSEVPAAVKVRPMISSEMFAMHPHDSAEFIL